MSRYYPNSAMSYRFNGSPASSGEQSWSIWFRADTLGATMMAASDDNGVRIRGFYHTSVSPGVMRFYQFSVSPNIYVDSSNTFTANTWNHAGGLVSTTKVAVYLNGVETANTGSYTIPTCQHTAIGGSRIAGFYWRGYVMWLARWNTALTADEFLSLSKGAHPFFIRPDSLVQFNPLGGLDAEVDNNVINGATYTKFGSPTWSDQSPAGLIYPSQQIIGVPITPAVQHARLRIGV